MTATSHDKVVFVKKDRRPRPARGWFRQFVYFASTVPKGLAIFASKSYNFAHNLTNNANYVTICNVIYPSEQSRCSRLLDFFSGRAEGDDTLRARRAPTQ